MKYETKQRHMLLSFICDHPDEALSTDDIGAGLRDAGVSLSAVYRNLSELEAEGTVTAVVRPGERKKRYRFAGADGCRNHLHLACLSCGKTIHLDGGESRLLAQRVRTDSGFDVNIGDSILYGVCSGCRGTK